MASLGWFVFSAGGAVSCLLVCAGWTVVARRSPWPRRLLVLAAMSYWAASAHVVPTAVKRVLAAGFTPLRREDVPEGRTAVVLLGSGARQERDWAGGRITVVDPIGASRLVEAARVYHLVDATFIVSSGGLIAATPRNWAAGEAMADGLASLGVPRDRVIVETESATTRDEAVVVKRLLAEHPVDHVVLVTSQFHMRRSVGAFRAEGIQVIPAIAYESVPYDTWWERFVPSDKALEESGLAAHELGGLFVYRLRGWYR